MSHLEEYLIPEHFEYRAVTGLGREAIDKLSQFKPRTIGQASRILGVSPSDLQVLLIALRKTGVQGV